jgi:hypothetical protein
MNTIASVFICFWFVVPIMYCEYLVASMRSSL